MSTPVSEPPHVGAHSGAAGTAGTHTAGTAGTAGTGTTGTGTTGTAGHTSATPGASSTGTKKGFVQALEPLFKVSMSRASVANAANEGLSEELQTIRRLTHGADD